jgi:hypothetical protein
MRRSSDKSPPRPSSFGKVGVSHTGEFYERLDMVYLIEAAKPLRQESEFVKDLYAF